MKNTSIEVIEASRPDVELTDGLDFCLKKLYADKNHNIEDDIVAGLTFEELIGVLLLAKDASEHQDLLDSLDAED